MAVTTCNVRHAITGSCGCCSNTNEYAERPSTAMSEYYCEHGQPEGAPCDECAAKQEGVRKLACAMGANAMLDSWFRSMPTWIRDAYLNDPFVNRVMKECALQKTSRDEMQLRLLEVLYEQRNQWRETALHLKQYEPLNVVVSNDQARSTGPKL
jgi:hypothetical protein